VGQIRRIAVNTGGGDAPGLNAVIRSIVLSSLRRGGGTILGTTNRNSPFEYPVQLPGEELKLVDRSDEVVENFRRLKIDALIAIGGDGSMRIASRLVEKGVPIVGVPKTIDNDLSGTVVTFGFDTAVTVATEAIDRPRPTSGSS